MAHVNPTGSESSPSHPSQIDADLQRELDEALGDQSIDQLMEEATRPIPPAESSPDAPAGGTGREGPQRFIPEMVRGRIARIHGDDVFIDVAGIDGKNQGVVPLLQFERPPRLGAIMDFVVQRFEEAEGLMILSREGAVSRATWEQLQKGSIVEARVVSHNKGGLELEMIGGIRGFMPASQVDLHHVGELESLIGQKFQAMVQEIDRKGKKVVLSRRAHLEQERRVKEAKLWQTLAVGDLVEGTVSSVMDYGAFVDIGGADGLIHVSDLSYTRVDKASEIIKPGDKVRVKVLKLDPEKKRISLGLKQVAPDPWDTLGTQIKAGEQISGRVMRVADFGAFIEVAPGVEGLLPISEMSWKRIHKPTDVVQLDQVVRVAVLGVDLEKRRMTLSLKQAAGDPWIGAEHKYAKHALVEGTVLSTPEFGAFVELESGIEGLVHISELSDRRVNVVTDVVQIGQRHQFRVLEVDEEQRRIRLSLKQVKELTAPAANAGHGQEQRAGGSGPGSTGPGAAGTTGQAPAAAKSKPRKPAPGKGGLGTGGGLGKGLGDLRL